MLPNPGAPQTTCQIVFYLAWCLIDPKAEAKLLVFRTSNLPPSKEGGQGDCGRVNQMTAWQQKALSLRRQPFCHTIFRSRYAGLPGKPPSFAIRIAARGFGSAVSGLLPDINKLV